MSRSRPDAGHVSPARTRAARVGAALLAGTLAWLLWAATPAHAVRFAPAVQFGVGDGVRALAAGDYDGDGSTDVLTAAAGTHLRLARGDGRGAIAEVVELEGAPLAHAVDLTGDGLGDLVDVRSHDGQAEVVSRVANGTGDFDPLITSPGAALAGPYAFAAGDVDADGHADLVVAAGDVASGRHLWVAPGRGDGSFGSWWRAGATAATSAMVALPDANGDGRPELAGADDDGTVWISFSDALLGFSDASARRVADASRLGPIVVGTFSTRARPALAVVDRTRGCIALLAVESQATESPPCFAVEGSVTGLTAADLDGDGVTDLVATTAAGGVAVLAARDGALVAPVVLSPGVAAYATDPLAPDLNADGKPDIVAVANLRSLAVLRNIGAPEAVVSSPSVDFGAARVGSASEPQSVVVSNAGDWALAPAAARLGGSEVGDFEIVADLCRGRLIPAGSRCAVLVRFVPRLAGERVATLLLGASGIDGALTVTLRGTGQRACRSPD